MMQSLKCIILLCAVVAFASHTTSQKTGVLYVDEITGYTDLGVYIPRFAANDSLITSLTIRQFKAIRNSGFSLDTVGGIRFVSEGGISASTPGNLTLGSVVGGDVIIQGKLVNLTSFEEDLRFAVAGESIIASRGGFDLNVVENNGTVNFFSTLKTTVSAADSLILSSTNDTVQISAEQGAIDIHNDLVALVASEILQLGSLEDILVRASREFDALSYSSTEINAFTRLSVDSISRNIEFQAQNDLLIQADSNVYVTSSDDLHFETLLGDISLRANEAVSLYGRSLQHNATDINFSAAGALLVTGDGHLNLYSKNDVVYQADSSVWLAYDSTEFIGLSDADILFDLNSAFQSSSQFNVETANVNNSAISVVGKVIAFQTFSRDAIHVKASSLQTRAPLISFYALDGSVDLTTSPELYSAGTLGSTSLRDGSFGVNNAGATTVRADNTISLKADGMLGIVDDTFIQLNAGRNVRAALNGFYFNANDTQTFNVGATARYYGNDLVRITSGTFTSSATNHSEINTQFQQSFTINSSVSYSNIDDMTTTVREGRYALSTLSLTNSQASDVVLEGQSVTFKSAAGAVDGNPTSQAFFITKDGLTITSANFTSVSQETTELSVPSGDGVFTAGNDIVLTSGEDATIESVTGDINFVGDALLDATAENIVFRTGNGLQLSGNNTIVFNTTSIVFQSASDIVLASDGLIVSSNDSVAFNAGYSAEFISRTDFDITSAGDIGLTGGRITLAAKGDLTLDVGSVDFSSADRNNIEFYARDGGFTVNTLSANTTYSANDVRLVSQSESDDVGFSTVALNGDVTITSLGDLNITQALAGLGNGTAFSAQINNNTLFQGQYYLETSSLAGGDITYSVNGSNTLAATTSYNLMFEDSFLLVSESDVVLTGGDIAFTILPYNQEEETDNSSSFDFSNDINLTSCIGNLTTESPTLAISGETLLVSQSASSCNGTTVPVGSSFDIITHADRYQLITTVGDHIYQAFDNISLRGGRVTGTAASGTLTITSDNNVDIRSQNEDNLFADETDDRFYGQQVTFNASTTATFVQHGLSSDGDYSLDRHYGIRVDTQVGDLELRIPDSYFNVTALEGRVVLVAGELSNFDIVNTRSLFVDAGEGAVLLSSHGYVTNDTVTPSTAIQFFAALGNIAINAPLATVSLSGNQPANPNNDYFSRGLQVQSRFQNVNITAVRNIEQYSSDLDGALNYFSLTQELPVVAPEGISISSGDRYFSMKSDVRVNSARNLLVNTSGQQIYRASGPSTVENNPAIILRAQDGSILFTTPDDQQFLASGSLTFDSANDQIVADVANSIYLTGTSQILLASTLNSAAVVTGPGDITVRGRAGGASVTFASDLAQAIEATAGGKINSYARHDAEYYASTGFLLDTNQGSVLFDQQGRGESRYHSGGSLLLSAAAARGVRFEGQDYWANAGRDITIDATQQFSIGATSLTDTATSPTQTFNAGGTIGNVGLLFDILGGETWTVSGRGPVDFESVRATWTAVGDISLQSNGPVVFLNKGEFAQASLVINTESSFTMAAGRSVEFASDDTLQLSAPNIIELLAKGASTEDVSQISSNNNWVVNAPALNMFTGTFEGGARDFSVTAASVINFETEVGQGGSILVDSDSYTTVSAVGPVYIESGSTFDVFTQGIDNDIDIIAENSNVSISSGGSFNTDSRTSRIQAFNGATLNAVDGDFTVEASGNIELTANGTANYQAIESILIKVDFPQDLGQVRLNVSSRGDLSFNATESIELISADVNDPFIITADADLLLRNSAPRRPSEQGDVIFTGSSYAFNSRGDATVNSNVIANNIYAGDYTLSSGGDQTYTTTAAGASILVETAGNILIHSADQLTFAALTTLTVNTGDIVWEQDEQNGYGGIVIGSTAINAATVFTFAGASTFAAEDAIRGNTNGYLLFKTPSDISITATSKAGANVQIENQGTGGVQVNTRVFAATSAGDAIDDVLRVSAVGGVVGDDVFPLSVNAATISFAANDGLRGDINVQSSNNVQFNNPKLTTPTSIDIESQQIIIDANGYNYDRFGRTYAVSIEIDETIAFDAGDNVMFASMRGATNVVASETLKFTASQTFNAYAGHDLVIRTGFTPQPNQQPPDRSGIVFSAQGNGAARAAAGDITLSAEDVSWSTATQLNMRSVGSTTFSSPLSLMSWVSQSSITFNADSIQFYGTRRGNFPATDILASNSVTFRSRSGIQVFSGNLFLQSSGTVNVIADEIDFINADAIKEYNFNSNFGSNNGVRMFVNNFIIPLTDGDAGLSQTNLATSASQNDLTRGVEENHYPTCVNRQFTYDSQTGYVCYCQFSKWRCNRLAL